MSAVKYLFFLLFLITPTLVAAAETANVRFGRHADYERLVFEWAGNAPEYNLEQKDGGLQIQLGIETALDTSKIAGADSAFINEFQIQGGKQVFIFLKPYDKIRDMRIGRKLILDIYGPMNAPAKSAEQHSSLPPPVTEPEVKKAEPPKVEPKAGPVIEEKHGEPEHHASQVDSHDENKHEEESHHTDDHHAEPAPPQTMLHKALENADATEPHAFILSSADGVRIAAYKRFGYLWVLANRVNLPIEPYIEGANPAQFRSMTRYEVADDTATLWQIELPESFYLTGEGGSLYWRLVLSTGYRPNTITPSRPTKEEVETEGTSLRSGKVVFPVVADKSVVTFTDPVAGDTLKAVVVDTSEVYSDTIYEFVDFDTLVSPVGLVFAVKNPALVVKGGIENVSVYTDEGLVLTSDGNLSKSIHQEEDGHAEPVLENRLFRFKEWQMGPKSALEENQRLLLASLRGKSTSNRAEQLMSLAKLNLAHGRGAEAKGLAENARAIMPQMGRSPQFQGIRGVASYLAAQYDLAIEDFANPALDVFPEINMWRSATLAHLGDWQQAIQVLPDNFDYLKTYPSRIATPLSLTLAEVALRNGDKNKGEMLLASLEEHADHLSETSMNGIKYLKGEIFRQNNEIEEAVATWTKLSKQEDPLYRTKAELALVALGRGNNTVDEKEAVDRLENLRFVWRGDDLEVQVLQQLGLAEIEAERYVDGFKTLRDTVVLSANNALNDRVTNLMMQTYEDLFLTDKLETVSPLDAAMLYEEFRELTPSGEKGDRLVGRLAERLVDANLLGRAVKLLAYQLDYRLKGEEAVNTALRMASIQLMDRRAKEALNTLSKAETLLARTEMPNKNLKEHDLDLLKARALSDAGDVNGALTLLEEMSPPSEDISRLSADIAWKAGRWNDAASSLRELVMSKEYDSDKDFKEADAQLLLNYAITLNLSGQRITLRNIRERHLGQMQATSKGEMFEVITRPRQDALLADRNSILSMIGETEIFSDFLDSYKSSDN